jgi:radical SAM superfamily enzyme YgiQ (UPF0313 family)
MYMGAQSIYREPHFITRFLTYSAMLKGPVNETQINVRTGIPCKHAKCTFCAVKDQEEKRNQPLAFDEAKAQIEKGFQGKPTTGKLVLIANTHSLLTSDVLAGDTLLSLLKEMKHRGVREVGLETRLDYVPEVQHLLKSVADLSKSSNLRVEIVCGIETPDGEERNTAFQKGLSDDQIKQISGMLFDLGFGFRAYHIYKPPVNWQEKTSQSELAKLKQMVLFLSSLKRRSNDLVSLYVIPGYATPLTEKFVPPQTHEIVKAMGDASKLAATVNVPMILDLVEDDIAMTGSTTRRELGSYLKSLIEDNNARGWLF